MAGLLTVCRKELADNLGSKRYMVFFALIIVLSTLSAYQGAEYIKENTSAGFVSIFSGAQYGFPFTTLMVFFGPIIGLALGFDAINKEKTSGSLSVLLSQPIYRDSVLNGKFLAGIAALSLLTGSTIGIMSAIAIPVLGFGPDLEAVSRISVFALLTILYLSFWLALGLVFSTVTKKTTTSILVSVATWLFFSIVITIIAMLVANVFASTQIPQGFNPGTFGNGEGRFGIGNNTGSFNQSQTQEFISRMQQQSALQTDIQRISPAYLYSEASSAILGVTSGGGFGFIGRIGGSMPFRSLDLAQGLTATWPQIAAIAVGLVACFASSYMLFLRQEIRPGD
jgi:ABC-2 type transport system permease protein